MKIVYRKKGLPKQLPSIPGGIPGLRAAYNMQLRGTKSTDPRVKIAVFKNKKSMRDFYSKILPKYTFHEGDKLERDCLGCVCKLAEEVFDPATMKMKRIIVDKNYFCLVLLVEGHLTAEVLCHEAVHVGFAWDYRTQGNSIFAKNLHEENVCYPAGIFYSAMVETILADRLKESESDWSLWS